MCNREARTLLPRQQWAEPPGARRPAARGGDASGMLPVSRLRPVRLLVCPPWTRSPGSGLPACAPALNAKACPSGEPGTDHTAAWKPTLWRPPRAVSSSLGSQLKCLLLTEAFPDRAVESTQVLRQTHPILLAAGAYHTYHLLFMPRTPGGKLLRAGPSFVAFPAGSGSVPGAISNSVQTWLLCLTRGRSEQPATLGQHKHATPSHGHAGPAPPVASAVHLSSSSWAGSEISHPSELVTLYLAPVAPAVPARLTQPRAPVALRASCLSTALPVTVARGFLCPALCHPPPVRLIPELGIGVPPRAAAPWTHRPSLRTAYFEIFSDTGCREECEEAPCALCPAPQW